MRRIDLQLCAQAKLDDALFLLDNKRYSNAYYLSGYAIELGLKACISRQISNDTIPDKAFITNIFTHEYLKLVGLAGLRGELTTMQAKSTEFTTNWGIVSEWSPEYRYQSVDSYTANLMIDAARDDANGVFTWIKNFW